MKYNANSIESIRNELINENNRVLEFAFVKYSSYCVENLKDKYRCTPDEAKDIFIDSVIIFRDKVIKKELSYLTSLKSYLYGICQNIAKEKIRKDKLLNARSEDVKESLYNQNPNKEDLIIQTETELMNDLIIKESFARISQSCRKVLTLFYVHHYSMDEIAVEMNLANRDVAKSKKSRCYTAWKKFLSTHNLKKS